MKVPKLARYSLTGLSGARRRAWAYDRFDTMHSRICRRV